jgi:uncharacterized protein (DUF1697 family)
MPTYVALLRGINVVGRNRLPMRSLAAMAEEHGCTGVRTYIQSGNVVFRSSPSKARSFGARVGEAIRRGHGFLPAILVLGADDLERAAGGNPFPEAESSPRSLHLFFLAGAPERPDLDRLDRLKAPSESFRIVGKVLYLHAPDGIGRSKLAAQVERGVGVAATARNWSTVRKLLEMTRPVA